MQDEVVGRISVCYIEERPPADAGPFLKEERKLINTIATGSSTESCTQISRPFLRERS